MQFSYSGNFVSLPWTRATAFQTEILSTELPCTNGNHGTAFPTSARAWLAEYNPWEDPPRLRFATGHPRLLVVSLSCPMEQVGDGWLSPSQVLRHWSMIRSNDRDVAKDDSRQRC